MEHLTAYLSNFFLLVLFTSSFSLIGYLILLILVKRRINNTFTTLFFSQLVGIIFSVSIYSIWTTKFNTSNLLFGLILFFFIGEKIVSKNPLTREHESISKKKEYLKALLLSLILIIFIYSYFFWLQFNPQNKYFIFHDDYAYYSKASQYLAVKGENIFFDFFSNETSKNLVPYHYFELWLNSLITTIKGGLNISTFFLITYPLLILGAATGFLAVGESLKINVSGFYIVICAFFLFFGGLYLEGYDISSFLKNAETFSQSLFSPKVFKLILFYTTFLGFFILFFNKERLLALIFLLVLPIFNTSSAPIVLGFLVISIIVNSIYPLFLNKKEAFRLTVYTCLYFSFFLILYSNKSSSAQEFSAYNFVVNNLIGSFKTRINIIVGSIIYIFILYCPLIIIFLLIIRELTIKKFRRDLKTIFVLCGIVLTVFFLSIICWAIFFKELNASQLFYNTSIPLINIFFFIFTVYVFIVKHNRVVINKIFRRIWFSCVIILSAGQIISQYNLIINKKSFKPHDNMYLDNIYAYITSKEVNPIGVYVKGVKDYNSIFSKSLDFATMGNYMLQMRNGFLTVSISDFDVPIIQEKGLEQDREMERIEKGLFYKFVKNQQQENTFVSIEKSQEDFISKNKISYAIVSKNAEVPTFFEIIKVKEIEDPISGEKFIIFDPEKVTLLSKILSKEG